MRHQRRSLARSLSFAALLCLWGAPSVRADDACSGGNPNTDKMFKDILAKKPEAECQLSSTALRDQQGACKNSYVALQKSVNIYQTQLKDGCQKILEKQRECGAATQAEAQKCIADLESLRAKTSREIAQKLDEAVKAARKYQSASEDVAQQFANDQRVIAASIAQAQQNAITQTANSWGGVIGMSNLGTGVVNSANAVNDGSLSWNGSGEVTARDGGASTLKEYQGNFSRLTQEQKNAQSTVTGFTSAAQAEIKRQNDLAIQAQTRAAEAAKRSLALGTNPTNTDTSAVTGSVSPAFNGGEGMKASALDQQAFPGDAQGASKISKAGGADSSGGSLADGSGGKGQGSASPLAGAASGDTPAPAASNSSGSDLSSLASAGGAGAAAAAASRSGSNSGALAANSLQAAALAQQATSSIPGTSNPTPATGNGVAATPTTNLDPADAAKNAAGVVATPGSFVSGAGDLPAYTGASRAPASNSSPATARARGGDGTGFGSLFGNEAQPRSGAADVKQFNTVGSLGTTAMNLGGGGDSSPLGSLDSLLGAIPDAPTSLKSTDAALQSVMKPFATADDSAVAGNGEQAAAAPATAERSLFALTHRTLEAAQKRGLIMFVHKKL